MQLQLSTTTIVLALAGAVSADFTIWLGTCNTGAEGGDFSTYGAATDGQGGCGGCSLGVHGGPDGGGYSGGNPCNDKCEDSLRFPANGDKLDIIVESTGIKVGECVDENGENASCNGPLYACSLATGYRCITDYCV